MNTSPLRRIWTGSVSEPCSMPALCETENPLTSRTNRLDSWPFKPGGLDACVPRDHMDIPMWDGHAETLHMHARMWRYGPSVRMQSVASTTTDLLWIHRQSQRRRGAVNLVQALRRWLGTPGHRHRRSMRWQNTLVGGAQPELHCAESWERLCLSG